MPDQSANEPTMDEVLASIRRIITDEAPPVATAAPAPHPASEREPEPVSSADPAAIEAEPEPELEPEPAPESEFHEPEPEPEPASALEARPDPEPSATEPEMTEQAMHDTVSAPDGAAPQSFADIGPRSEGSLVDSSTSAMTASSFERLSAAVKVQAKEPSEALPAPGRSIEDVARDLLRPMLKAWLDENLPDLVRQSVDEEVARIARRTIH